MEIRALTRMDLPGAMDLVWRVFVEYESAEYPAQGVENFRAYIALPAMEVRLADGGIALWGAFVAGQLAGVLGARSGHHISLLFVETAHQRRGIARALVEEFCQRAKAGGKGQITVNASPYGLGAYGRLGFVPTGPQQQLDGMIFTPMVKKI